MKQKFAQLLLIGLVFLLLFALIPGCSNDGSSDSSGGVSSPEPTYTPPANKRVVAYFTSWGIYERNYKVPDIPASTLTHLNYAFFDIDESTYQLKHHDIWADVQIVFTGDESKGFPDQTAQQGARGEAGNLGRLKQLKVLYPHIKTMMSLGGYSLSYKFPTVAKTDYTRQSFVSSSIAMMVKYNFDGIDIDWEFPTADNTENFLLLLAEFRKQLDKRGEIDGRKYELSFAAPAGHGNMVNMGLDRVSPYVDFINIMAYDFHGGWEEAKMTNYNAPLYKNPNDPSPETDKERLNISYTVDYYLNAGVPSDKINLGLPLYGRAWEEVPSTNYGLFQKALSLPETGKPGNWEAGSFDYWKIQQLISEGGYIRYWDDYAKVPWLYGKNISPEKFTGGMFVTYDDVDAITGKVQYMKDKNLGGIMFWELSGDIRDINNPKSLVRTANECLNKE